MSLPIPEQPVMIPGTDKILSNLENIPDELKELEQWVLYGDVGIENPRTGEIVINKKQPLRIPDHTRTVWNAASNKPDTWTDFATAHHHLKESLTSGGQSISNEGQYLGVGFVAFHPDTPYVVIDIDDCIDYAPDDTDRLEPRVEHHIGSLVFDKLKTYTEISPSGNGLRCILKYTGSIDTGEKHKTERRFSYDDWSKSIHLELYGSGQYGRMTGNLLDPALNQISEQNQLFESLWMKCEENRTQSGGKTSEDLAQKHASNLSGKHLSDNDVLRKLKSAGNKDKFETLFNYSGSISGDDSADDMALAQIILFYCANENGRDLEQCLRILQQSPRWNPDNRRKMKKISAKHIRELQEKAVNKAYDRLLQDAEKGTASVWAPKKRTSAPTAAKAVNAPANQPEKSSPEPKLHNGKADLGRFFEISKAGEPVKSSFKHDDFAFYMIDKYKVIRIDEQLHIYQDGIYIYSENLILSMMIDEIPMLTERQRKESLSIMRLKAPERSSEIKPELMAYQNGILDITTLELLPFTPELTLTYKIPFDYNPDADCKTAERALLEIANGNEQRRTLLLEAFGYCLYPSCKYEKMFVFMGTDGSNGKSTILDWFKYSLGKVNYATVKPHDFSERFANISQYHKLANFMDDVSASNMGNTASSTMRNLISGQEIDVEQKGQPRFRMAPVATQIMACNKIPKFGTESYSATLRRLIIIDFQAVFSLERGNLNVHLKEQLQTSESAEWLIKEAVQAFHNLLIRQNLNYIFTECDMDRYLLDDYKKDNDTFYGWIEYLKDTESVEDLRSWFIGKTAKYCHTSYCYYMTDEVTASYRAGRLDIGNLSKRIQHEFQLTTWRTTVNGKKQSTFKAK